MKFAIQRGAFTLIELLVVITSGWNADQISAQLRGQLRTWFVYDPNTGKGGDGAIPVNSKTRPASFTDGLSNTIGFCEVKTYQAYLRDSGNPNGPNVPPAAPRSRPHRMDRHRCTRRDLPSC
jgi:Protein of unknown function (DUF1559)